MATPSGRFKQKHIRHGVDIAKWLDCLQSFSFGSLRPKGGLSVPALHHVYYSLSQRCLFNYCLFLVCVAVMCECLARSLVVNRLSFCSFCLTSSFLFTSIRYLGKVSSPRFYLFVFCFLLLIYFIIIVLVQFTLHLSVAMFFLTLYSMPFTFIEIAACFDPGTAFWLFLLLTSLFVLHKF